MVLPTCRRCGESDPRRMVGLMTLWFGSFIELEPAHGYFYLCPSCYRTQVAPHLEDVQETLARLHPSTAAFLDREHHPDHAGAAEEPEPTGPAETTDGAESASGDGQDGAVEGGAVEGGPSEGEPTGA